MSGDLGALVISLTAETVQFHDALTKAATKMDASMGQMVQSVTSLQKPLAQVDSALGAFGVNLRNVLGLAAGGAFAGLISGSIDSAAHIQRLSNSTGILAGELAAMKGAAAAGGISIDDVAKASTKFSKAIETQNEDTGQAQKALAAMGLSLEELKDQSPAEQMHTVAQRMNEFADGTGKAAAQQVLFGKSGTEIATFLQVYGEQLTLTKDGYAEYARNALAFEQSLGKLKAGSQAIVTHYAQELLPSMQGVVNGFLAMNGEAKDGFSVMSVLGEVIRTLALGVATAAYGLKDFANTITGTVSSALKASALDMRGAVVAYREMDAKSGDLAISYHKFVDEVTKGSKWFGDASDGVKNMGEAAANTKPKIDLAAQSTSKAADAAQKWLESLQHNIDKLTLTETELLKLEARQKGLGASADALIETYVEYKTAMEAAKKADEEAESQLKKNIEAAVHFHDELVKKTVALGESEEAAMKYEARLKGLGDTEDDNIRKLFDAKNALEEHKKVVAAITADWNAYVQSLQQANNKTTEAVAAWAAGNDKLRDQISVMGATKEAVELLAAANKLESLTRLGNLLEDTQARQNYLAALKTQYDEQVDLILSGAEREAMVAESKAASEAILKNYEDTAKSINKTLTDNLYDALVGKGRSFGEQLKSFLENLFKNLILRPILQPVSNYLSGLYQEGTSAVGGLFGSTGLFAAGSAYGNDPNSPAAQFGGYGGVAASGGSWAGAIGGAAIGGAITSQYGSRSPYPGMVAGGIVGYAATAGIAAAGTALAAGATAATAATTAFAAAAAAVPVIGWIVAAIAIIASFAIKPGGGPKSGGSGVAMYDSSGGMTYSGRGYDPIGPFYTPNDQDANLQKFVGGIGDRYRSTIAALGGKSAAVSFGIGYDMDQQGTAPNRLGTYVGVNGHQVYGFRDMDLGRDPATLQSRMSVEASRMLLAAVQASELPADVAKLLNGLMPAALGSDQISNVLAYAAAFHGLPKAIQDGLAGVTGLNINPETSINLAKFGAAYAAVEQIINADPSKDVQGVVDAANATAIEKFRAQGSALTDLAKNFDGSADAALNLAQATATYYNNMVQLLAALEQSSAAFHAQIQDTQRTFLLDVLSDGEKQAYFRRDFDAQRAVIDLAKSNPGMADPAQVQSAAAKARQDLIDWWATLSVEEKRQQQSTFNAQLGDLDSQVTEANKAIGEAIKAANDPKNPDSPMGQVKASFDAFMLDMGKWLADNRAVATSQTDAASAMQDAADTMQGAANTQLAAAQTPILVEVSGGGGEAGQ